VLGVGAEGSWDSLAVGAPSVRCFFGDDEQRWFMWYSGRAGGPHAAELAHGCVGLATSTDGVEWERGSGQVATLAGGGGVRADSEVGASILPNADDWWTFDTCHVGAPDVQILSSGSVKSAGGVYWCFYTGGDFEDLAEVKGTTFGGEGARTRIGLALSQDGRNWARVEGPHHTGAMLDCGEEGAWDARGIAAPSIVLTGPREYRMYYHAEPSEEGAGAAIGVAVSKDGLSWERKSVAKPVLGASSIAGSADELGVAHPNVFRVAKNAWVMFYEGRGADGRRSVCVADSTDGYAWERQQNAVFEPSTDAGAWDAGAVGSPNLVPMAEGKFRLYYAGASGAGAAPTGIGLALGSGPIDGKGEWTFRRRGETAQA